MLSGLLAFSRKSTSLTTGLLRLTSRFNSNMPIKLSLPSVKVANSLQDSGFDGIILVSSEAPGKQAAPFGDILATAAKINVCVGDEGGVFPVSLPAGRLIYAPTGNVTTDYADARCFREAAAAGIKRAIKAGVKTPLLVLPSHPRYKNAGLVSLLGALEALYVPIAVREEAPEKLKKPESLGVWSDNQAALGETVAIAVALEHGRYIARDIGGGDPERMAAPRVEEYVRSVFANSSNISIQVVKDQATLEKEYPLMAAVNRAASVIERHQGRVILMTYEPPKEVEATLMLVGKGVTYDTGGADLKVNGHMAGMSRDKCGAAAVAGFIKVVSEMKPANLKVVAAMVMVRNSIGENSYVADEVITSRANMRVRIVNTDAEGRLAMADPLCQMKELAVTAKNPHLFTIATLTGHAALTVGDGYSIAMDNGPARDKQSAQKLQAAGDSLGDPIEISTIRREDFTTNIGCTEVGEDLVQTNTKPSAQTDRGHQRPAAFLLQVSGLDKHGSDSAKPIQFTHLDIASSGGDVPNDPTGAPILALAARFLLPKLI